MSEWTREQHTAGFELKAQHQPRYSTMVTPEECCCWYPWYMWHPQVNITKAGGPMLQTSLAQDRILCCRHLWHQVKDNTSARQSTLTTSSVTGIYIKTVAADFDHNRFHEHQKLLQAPACLTPANLQISHTYKACRWRQRRCILNVVALPDVN